jgi:hypothetical protein
LIDFKHPFRLKAQSARTFANQLDEWAIPFRACCNSHFHYVFEVSRFHLFCYWRPMTVARFEDYTIDYRGPHLPIFVSNKEYLNDDQYVHEGFDFAIRKNHRYRSVPHYFIIPAFLLGRPWPPEREWLWHPAVRVTKSTVKELLELEVNYGGWRTNRKGRVMIPRMTGKSGKSGELQPHQGWAKSGFDAMLDFTQPEQCELFTTG